MKKFLVFIFTILISIIICLLCISYGIKDACVNTISNSLVKREITSKIILSIKNNYNDVSYDMLEEIENEIGNNLAINKITAKYFDEIINSVTLNKKANIPNTKEELLSLIDENEYILKKHGIEVSDVEKEKVIDEIINKNSINDIYEKVTIIINKNLSDEQKIVANTYKIIISNNFRIICYLLIAVLIILIMAIKKSFYKFSINLSIALFLSGIIITFVVPILINMISDSITNKLIGETASINITKITNLGYLSFALASLFMLIYILLNKVISSYQNSYIDVDSVI